MKEGAGAAVEDAGSYGVLKLRGREDIGRRCIPSGAERLCRYLPAMRETLRSATVYGWRAVFSDLRHTASERAGKHTMSVAVNWKLGRVKQVCLAWLGEVELSGSHSLKKVHGPMAARAVREQGLCDGSYFGERRLFEQSAAEWQDASAPAIGEEAEVSNAWKASRQDMFDETAQELFGDKCHGALLAVVGIVSPAEADLRS